MASFFHFFSPLGEEPVCLNIGDHIVLRGAKNLVGDMEGKFLVGEPWIWDMCEKSRKYEWLSRLDRKEMIAISPGSSRPLGTSDRFFYKEDTLKSCEDLWKDFKLVICRDPECHAFMDYIGVNSVLLPCVSVFAAEDIVSDRVFRTVLVDTNLDSHGYEYITDDIKTWDKSKIHPYATINIQNNRWTKETLDAHMSLMASFSCIVSTRIHQVLPFLGRDVSIYPIDSRAETAKMLGVPVYPVIERVDIDLNDIRNRYFDVLNTVM